MKIGPLGSQDEEKTPTQYRGLRHSRERSLEGVLLQGVGLRQKAYLYPQAD